MHPRLAIGTWDVGIALPREPWQHGEAVAVDGSCRLTAGLLFEMKILHKAVTELGSAGRTMQ